MSVVGGVASLAVLATTVCNTGYFEPRKSGETESASYQFIPWGDADETEPEPVSVEPPEAEGRWIQFVDEERRPVSADVLVSAPGMWPFESRSSGEAGFLNLPANKVQQLGGDSTSLYEVIARAEKDGETGYGYWDTVRGPTEKLSAAEAPSLQLEQSRPLTLEIVDTDGEPVEGAYVRLGRGSVGLVHLEYTTGADGRAEFDALPPQSYYASIDAPGYAETSVTIDHTAKKTDPLRVPLQEGGGFQRPHAWRGPPVQKMVDEASSTSGGNDAGSGGSSSGSLETEAGGTETSAGATGASSGSDSSDMHGSTEDVPDGEVELDVQVLDSSDRIVGGAWVEVWADGRRIDEVVSRPGESVPVEVEGGSEVQVVATHPALGEGQAASGGGVENSANLVVRLDRDLFSRTAATDRVVWLDEVEDILEIRFVADGGRWIADGVPEGTAAAEAGLESGDSLLFLREEYGGYLAVVERGGRLLEFTVP